MKKMIQTCDQLLDEFTSIVIVTAIFGVVLTVALVKYGAIVAFVVKFFSLE